MAYTASAYMTALGALVVTGVTTRKTAPPRSVDTADLPVSFPRLVESSGAAVISLTSGFGERTHVAELVILVEPYQQNFQATNYAAVGTLTDAVYTSVAAAAAANGYDELETRANIELLGDTAYWALVTRITGSGT